MDPQHPGAMIQDGAEAPLDFDRLFRTEYRRLFQAMVLIGGDRAEADDVAQEAFVRVYERWDRISRMESPLGYLYRTAFNVRRSRLRRLARRVRTGSRPDVADPIETVIAGLDVRRAMRELSSEQREALVLVEWAGLTSVETSAVLGIGSDAVRARVHRARERLREELSEHE